MAMLDGLRVVFLEAISFADAKSREKMVKQWNEQCQEVYYYKNDLIAEEHYKATHNADVVPKSEYDAVVSAVDNSTKEFLKLHDVYQNAKAEVERLEGELIVERTRRENAVNAYHAAKSEVETEYKYCHVVGYAKVYTKTLEDYYKTRKSIAKEGKAEVAREIFEEIEKLSYRFMNDEHYIFGDMVWDIAELKKKYTGENTENENQN